MVFESGSKGERITIMQRDATSLAARIRARDTLWHDVKAGVLHAGLSGVQNFG